MFRMIDHGDVRELRLQSSLGRFAGLKVSIFLVHGTMIDCGFPRARGIVADFLAENRVTSAFLTHWHEDHSGNLATLAERRIPVLINPATLGHLPVTEWLPPFRWALWGNAPRVDGVTTVAESEWLVPIPTPGHTDDHQVAWDPATGTLFSGDLVLGVRVAAVHAVEDPRATLASLRRVAALEPERIFDAHLGLLREPRRFLAARITWLEDTIGAIEAEIAAGLDDRRIRDRLLGPETGVTRFSLGKVSKLNFVRAVRRGGARE